MAIRGAIFDMDGTLTDSMHMWYHLGEKYLKAKGIEPEKGLSEKFWNMSALESAEYMKQRYHLEGDAKTVMEEIYSVLRTFYSTRVKEKPGVRIVLDELEEKGIPMCVASATDTELVECALEFTGLRKYFGQIFCCRKVGAGKHTDKIYQIARESMGCEVKETAVFEDAFHAVQTVHQAGFPLVGIYDSIEPHQEEIKKLSNIYLTSYQEWPGIDWLK